MYLGFFIFMSNYKYLPGKDILDRYHRSIALLRSSIINSSILDNIRVYIPAWKGDYSIKELATVNHPEATQLLITPFDKNTIPVIAKAIQDSSLGVTPIDDGAGIRLNFPPLTEENRKQRVKELHGFQEESRKDLRVHRQDFLKKLKKQKEDGEISEDELKNLEKKLQEEVDSINKEIEEITKTKEADIMKI